MNPFPGTGFMEALDEAEPEMAARLGPMAISDTSLIDEICDKYGHPRPTGATVVHEHLTGLAEAIRKTLNKA